MEERENTNRVRRQMGRDSHHVFDSSGLDSLVQSHLHHVLLVNWLGPASLGRQLDAIMAL